MFFELFYALVGWTRNVEGEKRNRPPIMLVESRLAKVLFVQQLEEGHK
jgi:hypothetical protein